MPVRAFFDSWALLWAGFPLSQTYPGYAKAAGDDVTFNGKNMSRDDPFTAEVGTSRRHVIEDL